MTIQDKTRREYKTMQEKRRQRQEQTQDRTRKDNANIC